MKKNSSTRDTTLVIPILNDEYSVIVCWGDIKYIEKVQKKWHHGDKADVMTEITNNRGVCFYHDNGHPIICLPCRPRTAEEIGTLAHEAVHAVDNIMNKIGESKVEEVHAHSVGAIVRTVLKKR